ncbi:Arsenical resistance operon trans-acting repressor ArsD [Alkalispirochaeta americana]|uniref:Arsenical resistance operon trans-acting repressor ArsD n=1 Tax=Alkalispirochaeta americana TaxID=159291 RepID=A0A1N6SI28_9SPIO|nr:arsenite efflux transporter metallochaperone ArsD [Alkalispirochaeta americana]SIQ40795.1 Arsenical resistance operon trans-acting repressor ArsD [Alkalispirochaeta americana]
MSDTVTIEIFDPPMCCPGGLCGPAIDPALLDMNETILTLKNDHGIVIQRYLLQQQGQKFMENPAVLELLQKHNTDILPVTVVNGKVVKTKAFPTCHELLAWSGGETPEPKGAGAVAVAVAETDAESTTSKDESL